MVRAFRSPPGCAHKTCPWAAFAHEIARAGSGGFGNVADFAKTPKSLNCSADFTARSFAGSEYVDVTGRKMPSIDMTRDGFAFLAMEFTVGAILRRLRSMT